MTTSVSVPEKTLEHWASQYIAYRYASKAALWWPTRGEDLELGWLPPTPGKSVRLELKTTTISASGAHAVKIDIRQLWNYRQLPDGHQPFYAFPCPFWGGELRDAASAARRKVTELGFSRSGRQWWFAEWLVLITTAQVADLLRTELDEYGRTGRGRTCTLARFTPNDPTPHWPAGTAPKPLPWRKFWPMLEQCGRPDWPQLIRVPSYLASVRTHYLHEEVVEMMRAIDDAGNDYGRLVTLAPHQGGFRQVPDPTTDFAWSPERDIKEAEFRPLGVHLDVRALSQGN